MSASLIAGVRDRGIPVVDNGAVRERQVTVPTGLLVQTEDFDRALARLAERELEPVYGVVAFGRIAGCTRSGCWYDRPLRFRVWRGEARPGGLLVGDAADHGGNLAEAVASMAREGVDLSIGGIRDEIVHPVVEHPRFIALHWPVG
ncbi:MAG: hypothetical protein HYX34_02560 [Actinobacteria bacterium]|nr:hypothetical protein [Actinomycetota bacterium]